MHFNITRVHLRETFCSISPLPRSFRTSKTSILYRYGNLNFIKGSSPVRVSLVITTPTNVYIHICIGVWAVHRVEPWLSSTAATAGSLGTEGAQGIAPRLASSGQGESRDVIMGCGDLRESSLGIVDCISPVVHNAPIYLYLHRVSHVYEAGKKWWK